MFSILFCVHCGFIGDPDTAMKTECPDCKRGLSVAGDETAGIINLIRLRTPQHTWPLENINEDKI
jgi:hypothetical protein